MAERESVDGILNECEARRTEYWRSQICKTMSVSGVVGMAASRTREEWSGRRVSSWEVTKPLGRVAVNVKERRVRGVEIPITSQPEAFFCKQ